MIKFIKAHFEEIGELVKELEERGFNKEQLEKMSKKQIYREYVGYLRVDVKQIKAVEKAKEREKSQKKLSFNQREMIDRKKMFDFVIAKGFNGKSLGRMSFINLQTLYL
ncbi:hypothetical protein L1987_15515 [Smallanthus sonchifolius]|uniref:Uncharacterized protein n=1 Tax=Smallanthus sonchifolius TaxID=185202 RepID=A0ACB9J990_9ASTR|nr:hypothetical protein L1987_15515 [Smallanthus sonchifolius]